MIQNVPEFANRSSTEEKQKRFENRLAQTRSQNIYGMRNIGQMAVMCSGFGVATYVNMAKEPHNLECVLRLQATQSEYIMKKYKKNSGHRGSAMDAGTKL